MNREYFFGGGIQVMAPELVVARYGMQPVQVVPLGATSVSIEHFESFLRQISPRFTAATYDLLNNNCNNFSHELAMFLLGVGIPQHILDLPNEALSTPLGYVRLVFSVGFAVAWHVSLTQICVVVLCLYVQCDAASNDREYAARDECNRNAAICHPVQRCIACDGRRSSTQIGRERSSCAAVASIQGVWQAKVAFE